MVVESARLGTDDTGGDLSAHENTKIEFETARPTKRSVLARIRRHISISAVVDVGVRECTEELIELLGDLKHYLFEPVPTFYPSIANNYAAVQHELFPLALSNSDRAAYLVSTSLGRNGEVTHSAISSDAVLIDGRFVVGCETIEIRRFDSLQVRESVPQNFLLKVDVDGQDLAVLQGFGHEIQRAAVVIVECTMPTLLARHSFLASQGFEIFDIIDLVYYGSGLYQVDVVFVRKDLLDHQLRPDITNFSRALWWPIKLD